MVTMKICFLVTIVSTASKAFEVDNDPCLTASNWTDNGSKSTKCHYVYDTCDRYIIPGWYRVQSESGENLIMPTSPVPIQSCGTMYPVWLNGSHPSVSDSVVSGVGCVTSRTSTCYAQYQIQIKNCSDFMVYNLPKTTWCNIGYCFGAAECPPPPTTTTTTTVKETTPREQSTAEWNTDTPINDPCFKAGLWTDNGSKSTKCHKVYDTCDRYIIPGWYRVQSESGENLIMPTSPVPIQSCGTMYPVWLNGSHPSVSDSVVSGVGCVTSRTSTCYAQYQIQIKNCSDFMVYNLPKTTWCNIGYCFGASECPPPPTTTTTTTVKETTPREQSTAEWNTDTPINDPCFQAGLWTDNGSKSTKCHKVYDTCDRYIIPGWYRVQSESGENLIMPTSPVPIKSCGTMYPVWLNGSHPSVSDSVVSGVGCVTSRTSTCYAQYQIQIKNCSDFMVYNLPKTTWCNIGYCFGNSGECVQTTTQSPEARNKSAKQHEGSPTKSDTETGLLIGLTVVSVCLVCAIVGIVAYIKLHGPRYKVKDVYGAFANVSAKTSSKI